MSEMNSHSGDKKSGPPTSQKVLPFFPADPLADGHDGEGSADRREESQHLARVRAAVGDYFARKRKRR